MTKVLNYAFEDCGASVEQRCPICGFPGVAAGVGLPDARDVGGVRQGSARWGASRVRAGGGPGRGSSLIAESGRTGDRLCGALGRAARTHVFGGRGRARGGGGSETC